LIAHPHEMALRVSFPPGPGEEEQGSENDRSDSPAGKDDSAKVNPAPCVNGDSCGIRGFCNLVRRGGQLLKVPLQRL